MQASPTVKQGDSVVADYVEVWGNTGPRLVALDSDRLTVGKDPSNSIALDDATVSRMHVAFERYPAGWSVRDLDSRNGTFVNGRRILAEQRLRSGDDIRIGKTRLVFRGDEA